MATKARSPNKAATSNQPSEPSGKTAIKKESENHMKVNFSNVATTFAPRAAGEYEGTLISHKLNPASASSGQPTVTLDWSENDSPNKHMFKTYSLQPQALWVIKRDLIRMGASVEEMNSEDADLDTIIEALYGYTHTLVYGDPRPGKDKDGNDREYDNFLSVKDPYS